jgi:hypothetical protein
MPNCALYGCTQKKKNKNNKNTKKNIVSKSYHYYEEKVFMRIFEESAKYYEKTGTKYVVTKSKIKTARGVMYNELNIIFSYALETSIHNVYNGDSKDILLPIDLIKFENIGSDFVNSLVKWDNKSKFYQVLKKIRCEEEEKKSKKIQEKETKEIKENRGKSPLSMRNRNKKKKIGLCLMNDFYNFDKSKFMNYELTEKNINKFDYKLKYPNSSINLSTLNNI